MSNRDIFLFSDINQGTAVTVINNMLMFERDRIDLGINLYLNTNGGYVVDALAIYDVMKSLKSEVTTICVGRAWSAGSLLLSAGTKRYAYKNADIMLHQPLASIESTDISSIVIQTDRFNKEKKLMAKLYQENTGKKLAYIENILDRDTYLTALEAKEFGLIDDIL